MIKLRQQEGPLSLTTHFPDHHDVGTTEIPAVSCVIEQPPYICGHDTEHDTVKVSVQRSIFLLGKGKKRHMVDTPKHSCPSHGNHQSLSVLRGHP